MLASRAFQSGLELQVVIHRIKPLKWMEVTTAMTSGTAKLHKMKMVVRHALLIIHACSCSRLMAAVPTTC